MQGATEFPLDISYIAREVDIKDHLFILESGSRIFFSGDLGSGKSTFIRALLREHFHDPDLIVRSPTYTYFQKYGKNVYHFDLYRITNVDDFFLIGGEDIMSDPESICLIEWPELLRPYYTPTLDILIEKISSTERRITMHHPDSTTE